MVGPPCPGMERNPVRPGQRRPDGKVAKALWDVQPPYLASLCWGMELQDPLVQK